MTLHRGPAYTRLVRLLPRNHVCRILQRNVVSDAGDWPLTLTNNRREEIEKHWLEVIGNNDRLESSLGASIATEKFKYILSMFPYPSGRLHMGHVRVYSISDALARYYRLKGHRVLHPMGWDAFGLPAENAAKERNISPKKWTYSNIVAMKKQLQDLCLSFDWDREFATCDPNYYKWTQYLFIHLFEHGLVYRKEAPVHWDPVDKTVLADEQVDSEGRGWRSGAKVERRFLPQYYIRTTRYAKELHDELDTLDPKLWGEVIKLQKPWIGDCNGIRVVFNLTLDGAALDSRLAVFTRSPECLHGASHILIKPEHLLDKPEYRDTTAGDGRLAVQAVNPLSRSVLPVYVSDTHDFGFHLDSHVGIPSVSDTDRAFARQHSLKFTDVIEILGDQQILINSKQLSGKTPQDGFGHAAWILRRKGCGGDVISEKTCDWLISRQRAWGTPIPLVHCEKYGIQPVSLDELPILQDHVETQHTRARCSRCDCDEGGLLETDTMDTFVDSSWYFLRYLNPHDQDVPFYKETAHQHMPVDVYIGGKEHALMHLYYARFINHFLYEHGLVPTKEPFTKLLCQGLVLGKTYKVAETHRYVKSEDVDLSGEVPTSKETGETLTMAWEKMSKSRYNGVDPQDCLAKHGVDATRVTILIKAGVQSDIKWEEHDFVGVERWFQRVWRLVGVARVSSLTKVMEPDPKVEQTLEDDLNNLVEMVSAGIEDLTIRHSLGHLLSFSKKLEKFPLEFKQCSPAYLRSLRSLLVMMSPFAPLLTSELWQALEAKPAAGFDASRPVLQQQWPTSVQYKKLTVKYDTTPKYVIKLDDSVDLLNCSSDWAMALAQGHDNFDGDVLQHGYRDIQFEVWENRVTLHFMRRARRNARSRAVRSEFVPVDTEKTMPKRIHTSG